MISQAPQSLAMAVGIGAIVTVICRGLRIPALLPLLGVGLILGKSGAGMVDASALAESLRAIITVSIGLLIFEGTLHLNRKELGHAPRAVWGLLTIGAIATLGGVATAGHWILGFGWPVSFLLGSILVVTGPTVVQPILRIMRVSPKLNAALAAEAILIDAIGVIATITTLELLRAWLMSGATPSLAQHGVTLFLRPMLAGIVLGLALGTLGYMALKAVSGKDAIGSALTGTQAMNLIAIGISMTCVGLGEAMAPEAGLVAVTICGLIMAQAKVLGATELRAFKELLATLLVGTLFILLASRFEIAKLKDLTWHAAAFIAAIMLLVRPLGVLLATWRSALSTRERAFAALFAPRGVVALAVCSIAATELAKIGTDASATQHSPMLKQVVDEVARLDTIVFVTIVATVLSATILSPALAWALRVRAGRGNAVLIVGAHRLGIDLAKVLKELGVESRIVDSNATRLAEAAAAGVDVMSGDATDTRWLDDVGVPHSAGWVIAWTGNESVDRVVARWGEQRFGPSRSAIWPQKEASPEWANTIVGWPMTRNQALARLIRGVLRLDISKEPEGATVLLGWINRGVLSLAVPGATRPKPTPAASAQSANGNDVKFFGLYPNALATTTVTPGADDTGIRDELSMQ